MKLRKMRRRVIALSLSVAIIVTGNGISTFGTTVVLIVIQMLKIAKLTNKAKVSWWS